MKVKLEQDCVVNGKPCKKGATVDVSAEDANLLIGMGRAVKDDKKAGKE